MRNPQKLKQLSIAFVDTSKAKLSCKLAVFPIYEMVMRFQASAQKMQASIAVGRDKLKARGLSTEAIDKAEFETNKAYAKETQIRLEHIDEYCFSVNVK